MDFLAKKMTAHHVYFTVQGVQDLFPDPLINRGKADRGPWFSTLSLWSKKVVLWRRRANNGVSQYNSY